MPTSSSGTSPSRSTGTRLSSLLRAADAVLAGARALGGFLLTMIMRAVLVGALVAVAFADLCARSATFMSSGVSVRKTGWERTMLLPSSCVLQHISAGMVRPQCESLYLPSFLSFGRKAGSDDEW